MLITAACSGAVAAPSVTPVPLSPTTPPSTATSPPATRTPLPSIDPGRVLQPGAWHGSVYHAGLGQVVVVNGGPESGKAANDPTELWAWDGQAWRLINEDGPPWRNFASVAYDAGRDVIVLYGGLQSQSRRFNELWEWDGTTWTERPFAGPGAREAAALVYDAARQQVVLFGGAIGLNLAGDTWGWDGETWTELSRAGPPARFPGAMAYDPLSERVLLYGGHAPLPNGDAADLSDLWAWDGRAWEELPQGLLTPGIRISAAMTHDPLTDRLLFYGGGDFDNFYGDMWLWDGTRWEQHPATGPGPRTFHGLVYDETRQRMVLFSGHDRPMAPSLLDTWEWDGTAWRCAAGC